MRNHTEIKWSEYVRRIINKKLDELEKLEKHPNAESIMTMLASEQILKKDWNNEADERWNNV